jgi:hypothetical protein
VSVVSVAVCKGGFVFRDRIVRFQTGLDSTIY